MNPYAPQLAAKDPLSVIAGTSGQIRAVIHGLGPEAIEHATAPGKWSAREIVCHLADTEIVFAFRLRQALAEPHHVIQPFDQALWASRYAAFPAEGALDVFTAVRNWNLTLIRGLAHYELAKPVTHPERGTMSLQTVVETMAGHDLNHLKQLEALLHQPEESASA